MRLLTLLALIVLGTAAQAQEKIKWMSFDEAFAAQKVTPKKLYVDAYTVWCGPCKRMEATTLSNPDVVAYINENFYPVKWNAEGKVPVTYQGITYANARWDAKKANTRNYPHELGQKLGVRAYPSTIFFDEEGKSLGPIPGMLPVSQMEFLLKMFKEDKYKGITTAEDYKKLQEEFVPTFKTK